MLFAVTAQSATAGESASIDKLYPITPAAHPHTGDHRDVEVDEVGVVDAVALRVADAVRVMANIARGLFFDNMFFMFAETLIAQDTVAIVAAVTQGIVGRALRGVVEGYVLSHQDRFKRRAVRTFWAGTTGRGCGIAVMAIGTAYGAGRV